MSEYVFRDAPGFGCDMNDMMDGGRVTVGEYFASESTDHYGTLHEEIVRCRDCKYMFDWAYDRMLCKMWADGGTDDDAKSVLYPTVEPDGFCSLGERRGDAE